MRWSCDILRHCVSIWDILSYGHTGLKTSYDHLRWAKFGWSWTIGEWIVRCYTTSQPSTGLARRLGGFWSCPRLYRVSYNHCATSSNVANVCTIFAQDVVSWSCDVLRHRTKSHNHRTTLIVLIWLLQLLGRQSKWSRTTNNGRTMSYYVHTIIEVPVIVPNVSQIIISSVTKNLRL